jgi:cation diffusion facilitator CzcD-associated flavoprotein CzcO
MCAGDEESCEAHNRPHRYPGVACDVPCHAYQFTFESNNQWSGYWAGGAEIQQYLKHVAEKYNAKKYMRFNHLVEKGVWKEQEGKWYVTLRRLNTGEVWGYTCAS